MKAYWFAWFSAPSIDPWAEIDLLILEEKPAPAHINMVSGVENKVRFVGFVREHVEWLVRKGRKLGYHFKLAVAPVEEGEVLGFFLFDTATGKSFLYGQQEKSSRIKGFLEEKVLPFLEEVRG